MLFVNKNKPNPYFIRNICDFEKTIQKSNLLISQTQNSFFFSNVLFFFNGDETSLLLLIGKFNL
jgi:hypothetical protein